MVGPALQVHRDACVRHHPIGNPSDRQHCCPIGDRRDVGARDTASDGSTELTSFDGVVRDDMTMDDDAISGIRHREELQLVRAFLGIADPAKRQRIIHLAERLADEVAMDESQRAAASEDGAAVERSSDA